MGPDHRRRALVISLALHAMAAWALGRRLPRESLVSETAVTMVPFAPSSRPVAVAAPPAPAAPVTARASGPRRSRRSAPRAAVRVVAAPVFAEPEGGAALADGDGDGDEVGGAPGLPGRRLEMAGRVVEGALESGEAGTARGLDYVSLAEATALRTHDFFPRLPLASWAGPRPYLVVIDLCVSPDGQVTEASLLSGRSSTLDPVVLRAVRTWRYRPRLVAGRPQGFCHVVTIRYEM
jgi:TonB family protein